MAAKQADNEHDVAEDLFVLPQPVIVTIAKQAEISSTERLVSTKKLTSSTKRQTNSSNTQVNKRKSRNTQAQRSKASNTEVQRSKSLSSTPEHLDEASTRARQRSQSDSINTQKLSSSSLASTQAAELRDSSNVQVCHRSEPRAKSKHKRVGFYWTDSDDSLTLTRPNDNALVSADDEADIALHSPSNHHIQVKIAQNYRIAHKC